MCPSSASASVNWAEVIDPNNFVPPSATFALIFISRVGRASTVLLSSAINFESFCACCLKFSLRTFTADSVARIALPAGIRKFLC